MFKRLKTWLTKQDNRARRTAGLKEKEEAIQSKLDMAMRMITNRRKKDSPISLNRRQNGDHQEPSNFEERSSPFIQ